MHKNIVLALSLAITLLLAETLHASEAKDCNLKQYGSFDLLELPNHLLLVPVTILSTREFMVLNTAGAFSTITELSAVQLGLQIKPMPSAPKVRAGVNSIEKFAIAKGFALQSAQFNHVDLMIITNEQVLAGAGEVQVIGSLGMDILGQFDVELDVASKKMNLFSPDHCSGRAVYWSKTYDSVPIRLGQLGEFYFPMELDGKKIETTIATGNTTTSLSTDVASRLYHFDKHSTDVETQPDGAGGTIGHYHAMKLSGEGLQIINAHILLSDPPKNDFCHLVSRSGAAAYEGCLGAHPLRLGLNILRKLRIYIATKEKILYFTPSSTD